MAAKQAGLNRDADTKRREPAAHDDSYLADWQRKSRHEIVRDAIASLRNDLRQATRKKANAG